MSTYNPPLADLRFLLREVAGLATIAALPGCAEASPDTVDAILEEAGRFCADVLAPLDPIGDAQGSRFDAGRVTTPPGWKDAYRRFRDGGWMGVSMPAEYGGQGLPKIVATPVWEMIHAANLAFSLCPQLASGQAEALLLAASDELRATWLPRIANGEVSCTMCLTEPQAGSDLAAIRTRAEPQADGTYRLFGSKIFITYGEHDLTANIVHLVLARLPDAPAGVKGISMFVVPKLLPPGSVAGTSTGAPTRNADTASDASPNVSPKVSPSAWPNGTPNDVVCTGIEHKLGIHASPTCAMSFGEKVGAVGWLVGEANRGLEYMFVMMNNARFNVGVQGYAVGERAYQKALAFASERVQGRNVVTGATGMPIVHHPDIQRTLLSMRARIMAARSLACTTAGWFDVAHHAPDAALRDKARRYVDLLMAVVKGWCTEIGQAICYDAIQVFGGMGFVEATGVARHYRDVRITTIYEGTTGIQANDLVGRKLLREDGVTMREFIADLRAEVALLMAADLEQPATRLAADVSALEVALDWILANGKDDLAAVLAAATPFLHLVGGTCASWQLGRIALAASRPECRAAYGDGYTQGLVDLAFFHATCAGVTTPALAEAVTGAGAGATAAAARALVAN